MYLFLFSFPILFIYLHYFLFNQKLVFSCLATNFVFIKEQHISRTLFSFFLLNMYNSVKTVYFCWKMIVDRKFKCGKEQKVQKKKLFFSMHLLRCNCILALTKQCYKFCKNCNRERKKCIKELCSTQAVADKCGTYYKSIPHGLKFTIILY